MRTPNVGAARHDLTVRLLSRSAGLRQRVANAGAIVDWSDVCLRRYGRATYAPRREALWERIAGGFGGPVRGVEFGVAQGYASAWWLDRLSEGSTWDGFDRFTGLPRAWRGLDVGAFDAGGAPPTISGPGITWHVGDIADTISDLSLDRADGRPWLVLFDFDLYEPSKVAWDHIAAALRPGDVIYLDEVFDRNERHLLDHHVLPSLTSGVIGWTPMALALRVA